MNIAKINQTLETLQENLGGALLAVDLFAVADGQSIAGINSQAKASALFNQLTDYLLRALKGADFPALGRYYALDLDGGNTVLIAPLGEYRLGILADNRKVQLGLILNVALPQAIADLAEALR